MDKKSKESKELKEMNGWQYVKELVGNCTKINCDGTNGNIKLLFRELPSFGEV